MGLEHIESMRVSFINHSPQSVWELKSIPIVEEARKNAKPPPGIILEPVEGEPLVTRVIYYGYTLGNIYYVYDGWWSLNPPGSIMALKFTSIEDAATGRMAVNYDGLWDMFKNPKQD